MAAVTRAEAGGAPARRVALPSWRDPRLVVGVLLVLAAVVAGARLVASADRTVPVFAAAEALTPGERVGADQLQVVRLRLDGGGGAAAYLSAARPPDGELVALRGVGAGELVPAAALGDPGVLDVRPVGVPVEGALPAELVPGALVDVWVTAVDLGSPGALLEPRRVVVAAPVAEVDAGPGALGSAATTTVQVLVGTEELPDVLAALAADAEVQLVLSPGGRDDGGEDLDPVASRGAAGQAAAPVPTDAPTAAAPATRSPAGSTATSPEASPTAAAPRASGGGDGATRPAEEPAAGSPAGGGAAPEDAPADGGPGAGAPDGGATDGGATDGATPEDGAGG
ncbi:hypothetical protein [uncultured Pseudokineococcus sp.]|uniref:hypothetical protein n=1 Tax=uncultured Pseudokineococcus sp. TaxID=1642928 RepID=UPI002636DB10|nr:hypothetical protein [uncultured Pseudokineococcus sp.]